MYFYTVREDTILQLTEHVCMLSVTTTPGKYILLRYTDPPWSGFYDIFKVIRDDLLIGRVYLGTFPRGRRLFTFPMVRVYGLENMTVEDRRQLYQSGTVPTPEQLSGLWEMRAVSNARNTGVVAYLKFDPKPDGRLEARYRFLGLLEGMSEPVFTPDHFQFNDFTPFRDEIRFLEDAGGGRLALNPGLDVVPLFEQQREVADKIAFLLTFANSAHDHTHAVRDG